MRATTSTHDKILALQEERDKTTFGTPRFREILDAMEPLLEQYEGEKLWPSSRPFPSKYYGVCVWSGQRIRVGDTIHRIDGIDGYVHERFVNMVCDPAWTRLDGERITEDTIKDEYSFLLVTKHGEEVGYTRRGDRIHRWNAWLSDGRAFSHFQSTFKAAVAIKHIGRTDPQITRKGKES